MKHLAAAVVLLTVLWAWIHPSFAADAVVGSGPPESCTESAFNAALTTVQSSGGGTITFDCSLATVTVTAEKLITSNVTLDGGGLITLSGGRTTRLFRVQDGSSLTLRNLVLTEGYSGANSGGAIYVSSGGRLSLEGSTIVDSATDGWAGSAIFDAGGTVALVDSLIANNEASYGAISSIGQLTLLRTTFLNNRGSIAGGALTIGGTTTIQDSTLDYNIAPVGGAMYVTTYGTVRATATTWTANQAEGLIPAETGGGAILSDGLLQIEGGTFEGNSSSGSGGAIQIGYQAGTASAFVTTSTFMGNQALVYGGAIYNKNGSLTVVNSTISGNLAQDKGGGLSTFLGPTTLAYVTLVNNQAGNLVQETDAGLNPDRQRTYLSRTAMVAGSPNCEIIGSPALDPLPYFSSQGDNLSDDDSCAGYLSGVGDQNNVDAGLGPLLDNGGPTQTHAPQPGSLLIDTAVACHPDFTTDQRGLARPQGGACDIGALEVSTASTSPAATPLPPPTAVPSPSPMPTPTVPAAGAAAPAFSPIHFNGSVRPTIQVSPSRAYGGQQVTISGQGVAGHSRVRIHAVHRAQTVGAVETAVTGGSYQVSLVVPPTVPPGTVQLCASAVGAANAELACTGFTIDPMPAGAANGQIQAASFDGWNAQASLVDTRGRLVQTVSVDSNGQFQFTNIPPGVYQYAISGQAPDAVPPGKVTVLPNGQSTALVPTISRAVACALRPQTSNLLLDRGAGSSPGDAYAQVIAATLPRWNDVADNLSVDWGSFQRSFFGYYVSGVPRLETFKAIPQEDGTVQKVIFRLFNANGTQVGADREDAVPPYNATFDMGQLAPTGTNADAFIQVIPVLDGQERCPSVFWVKVLADPVNHPSFRASDRQTLWNAEANVYQFQGVVPNVPELPFSLDIPWISVPQFEQYFGKLRNKADAGIFVRGFITEDGVLRVTVIQARAELQVLNATLLRPTDLKLISMPDKVNSIQDVWDISFKIPPGGGTFAVIPKQEVELPFVVTPVLSFFGLIDATVGSSARASFEANLAGEVWPFRPQAQATFNPVGAGEGVLTLGLRLFSGVADAGGGAGFNVQLGLPLTASVPPPNLSLQACPAISALVRVYAQVLWGILPGTRYVETRDIAGWSDCFELLRAASALADEEPPELIAAPVVAAGTGGQMLAAYVENTAAPGATPQVQVMARFQDPNSGQWLAATALSDPAHSASSPVVGFAGAANTPIVAWVAKAYDAGVAAALAEDFDAHLNRQDIFYSLYQSGLWSPPVRLTSDRWAEGMPTLATDNTGAVLAWVRDMDGTAATRADQRIAVATFDPLAQEFGAVTLLTGGATGLNGDVRATYEGDTPYLVWVYDQDAQLATAHDRRLAIATLSGAEWTTFLPHLLPVGVDSPAIVGGNGEVTLAFLVREPASDGSVGMLGTNGALWTARRGAGLWHATPLRDSLGAFVYAEQPQLALNQAETLLVFRRFGEVDSNAGLGQISLSTAQGTGDFSAPVYLTDEPQQNWQPALAVNPANQQATILNVGRPAAGPARGVQLASIRATESVMAATTAAVNSAGDPVESMIVLATADPALDPLLPSNPAAKPGDTILVTAVLRNVGRDPALNMDVTLYDGAPGSGTVLGTQSVAGPLAFNQTQALQFPIAAPAGRRTLTARLATSGGNATTANDEVAYLLGQLTAPVMDTVTTSPFTPRALDVTWYPTLAENATGYRVLRSTNPGGPFELIGESVQATFTDLLIRPGATYCYAVQSYNGDAHLSPQSDVVCILSQSQVFLPLVTRQN